MKKITFYLMMFLSLTAFAQIEVIENFDDTATGQVPAGWTETNYGASTLYICDGSAKSMSTRLLVVGQETLTTPEYLAISNGSDLTASFSYNIFEQVSQFPPRTYDPPAENWGSVELEYTIDNGANWINIITINDGNFTFSDISSCSATASINVGAIANGSDFQARFVVTALDITNHALWVIIDNVSFTQVPTTVPNCNTTLVSPENGSNTAEIEIPLTWQPVTGLPTGYTISVGTTSGGTDIVNAATTTEASYNLTGLIYETEYFVNIVPYNGVGDATGCTEESFTTRVAPIPGASCSSPIVVSSFPYLVLGDTSLYEDNFDASPCSNSYMSGKDVFYEITPASDMSINIELTGVDNNGASIHVVEGCIDIATECLAYVGTYSSTAARLLEEVVLLAGNTYYVVLSNSSNSRTYNYTLLITQNSCINPGMTLTPIADCGNGQFSVDVDVTYLGDATTLTLNDDQGSSAVTNINTTGIVTMGPYSSATIVSFVLAHDQDGTCSYGDSTYYYCPPTNDDCANSINLTVNTDGTCTNVYSGTNAGATKVDGDDSTCSSDNLNDVWYDFVATSETMVVEYLNVIAAIGSGGTIQATELLDGSCGSFTSLTCFTGDYLTFGGLTIGNTYYLRNYTRLAGEYAQNYDICVRELPTAPANDDCSNAVTLTVSTDDLCANQVAGSTIGATTSTDNVCTSTSYYYGDVWFVFNPTASGVFEFSLDRLSTTPSTYYSIFSGNCGALTELSTSCTSNSNLIISLDMAETYYVQVRSRQTDPGIDFNLCVIQLPDAVANSDCSGAFTLTESADVNGNNTITGNLDDSYNSPEGCSSSSYESIWYSFTPVYTGIYHFDFTRVSGSGNYTVFNTGTCANTTSDGYVTGITSCYNSGTTPKTGDLVGGNTYLIMVHASSAASFELFVYPDPSLSLESNNFESFKYYPNPVVNTLTVEARNTISEIKVFNIIGQEVKSITPNNLKTIISMNELNDGVYFITITINNSQKTIKIIKK